jgi:hypothetical protein
MFEGLSRRPCSLLNPLKRSEKTSCHLIHFS